MTDFNYKFDTQPDKDSFYHFVVYCAKNNVSDILIQGGAKIWVERYGRQISCSDFRLLTNRFDHLISVIWGDHIRASLRQGKIINTSFEIKGKEPESGKTTDQYGLKKSEVVRCRVNFTQATVNGNSEVITATLRVLNSKIPALKTLGLEPELFENVLPSAGLAIIGGATGSGKSTLGAAILQYCGEHFQDKKIITFEQPVEYLLGGKNWIAPEPAQSEVGRDVPSFAEGVALSALRRAPKIISIGELLEAKAFEAALIAGESGHFTMGTEHISTVGEAFPRSLYMFPADYREAIAYSFLKATKYIIVQRLIKSLDGKRIAVREYVIFDQEYKSKLLEYPHHMWEKIIDSDLIERGQSLIQKAFIQYKNNIISKEEMIEVAGTKKDFDKLEDGTYGKK